MARKNPDPPGSGFLKKAKKGLACDIVTVKGDSKNRIFKTINECDDLFFLPAV
jgi:hypothetical protein